MAARAPNQSVGRSPGTRGRGRRLAQAVRATAKEERSQVVAVLGTQWGDEGKGKLVDALASDRGVVARAQGGANAGHTVVGPDGREHGLHLMPSGILNKGATCVIGNGVVVHLPTLFEEVDELEAAGVACTGRLLLSDRAHLLFDLHRDADGLREEEASDSPIGTTRRGIGPAYASKCLRSGLRVSHLLRPDSLASGLRALDREHSRRFGERWSSRVEDEIQRYVELGRRAAPMITDSVAMLNSAAEKGERILVEGANATLLDIDHGTYPYVTSSNPTMGGIISGTGLPPTAFGGAVGVAKAYCTRVGEGPFPTEATGRAESELRERGGEFGTTTGRPRRCGWLDMVALRHASRVNGFSSLNLTKLDVLTGIPEIPICRAYRLPGSAEEVTSFPADAEALAEAEPVYEILSGWSESIASARSFGDLPANCRSFIERVEALAGVPCRYIGVGPGRDALIVRD